MVLVMVVFVVVVVVVVYDVEGTPRGAPRNSGSKKVQRGSRAHGGDIASYRISCLRFRWIIMSCTEPIVILSRFVSVALVKWP